MGGISPLSEEDAQRAIIAERVVRARHVRGFNKQQLAERCGLKPAFLSMLERRLRGVKVGSIRRIAKALDVSVDYLVGSDDKLKQTERGTLDHMLVQLSMDDRRLVSDFIEMLKTR